MFETSQSNNTGQSLEFQSMSNYTKDSASMQGLKKKSNFLTVASRHV